MFEKMPPLSELTKLAAENGVELPDEIVDAVTGGEYTTEEWNAMTREEQLAAQQRSLIATFITHTPCEMDPGVPHP